VDEGDPKASESDDEVGNDSEDTND
jgi:hypothetical protein